MPEFDEGMIAFEAEVIGSQDAVLLGRGMYDEWAGFWPTADYQPFADFINGVRKYVLTSTPLDRQWSNAEAVHLPVADLVRDLKAAPGGDIGVHGSIELARSMLAQGLVDELLVYIAPTLIGGDRLAVGDIGVTTISQQRRLDITGVDRLGDDILVTLTPQEA